MYDWWFLIYSTPMTQTKRKNTSVWEILFAVQPSTKQRSPLRQVKHAKPIVYLHLKTTSKLSKLKNIYGYLRKKLWDFHAFNVSHDFDSNVSGVNGKSLFLA